MKRSSGEDHSKESPGVKKVLLIVVSAVVNFVSVIADIYTNSSVVWKKTSLSNLVKI